MSWFCHEPRSFVELAGGVRVESGGAATLGHEKRALPGRSLKAPFFRTLYVIGTQPWNQ